MIQIRKCVVEMLGMLVCFCVCDEKRGETQYEIAKKKKEKKKKEKRESMLTILMNEKHR